MPTKSGYGIRMTRIECRKLILDYGWPDPPSSACVWCPHLDNPQWERMKKYEPKDFQRAIQVQKRIYTEDKQGVVYLHKSRLPLEQVDFSKEDAPGMFGCDSGHCMT